MAAAPRRPTLVLTVGLPATGKTTAARRIEVERRALRLTKDEWVKALYGGENPSSASDVIEGRLIQVAMRALELGIAVAGGAAATPRGALVAGTARDLADVRAGARRVGIQDRHPDGGRARRE